MISECLYRLPSQLPDFDPLPTAENWQSIPDVLRKRYMDRAQQALETEWPQITAADWSRFFKDGNRSYYEQELYFPRRRRVTDFAVAAKLTGEERFVQAALDGIWMICEETAWQIPAHNLYLRDTPQLEWPDPERPIIDLFAAETGALLSVACCLLKEQLPQAVQRRVHNELQKRIITPYLSEHFWWMGQRFHSGCNNWTPWCTQNVLLTAFCGPFSQEVRQKVVARAAYSLDCFLSEYELDGCCNEGAGYYGHAGLCLFGCLEILSKVAPQAFASLWMQPKIRNIAEYIFHMYVGGRYYVNFADCSPMAGRRGAREYQFARRCNLPDMALWAAQDWRCTLQEADSGGDIARINLWFQLIEVKNSSEMFDLPAFKGQPSDCWYPSAGVFVSRRGAYFMAAKAGCNADSHNHNDTGSVILYKDGKPFLIDIGVETYTQKTFSPQRYEIWTMQSAWHNLPTFDGVMQKDGAEYAARQVQVQTEGEAPSISMELSAAWPADAKLEEYRRELRVAAHGMTLEDRCCGRYDRAVLSLLTQYEPTPVKDGLRVGDLGVLRLQGGETPQIEKVPICDSRLRMAWPDAIYRIQIPFRDHLIVKAE